MLTTIIAIVATVAIWAITITLVARLRKAEAALEEAREEALDWNVRCQELTLEWRAECRESEALRERAQSLEVLATHAALLIREESWRHNDATLCDCCPLVVEVGECYPTCLTRHLLELSDIRETGRDPIETSDHLPF